MYETSGNALVKYLEDVLAKTREEHALRIRQIADQLEMAKSFTRTEECGTRGNP